MGMQQAAYIIVNKTLGTNAQEIQDKVLFVQENVVIIFWLQDKFVTMEINQVAQIIVNKTSAINVNHNY